MSSSNNSSLYSYYLKNVSIYGGIPIFIGGCIGGILNIIVLISLKTFRENSCAFYLTMISFVNIGHLLTGLLHRILVSGFDIDLTLISSSFCKLFQYSLQVCALLSITCLCLATIDQYFATCSHYRWREWSNIKISRRLTKIFLIIWLIHGIPCLIYFDLNKLISTKKFRCMIRNKKFSNYFIHGYSAILTGYLPIFVTILFGLLSYYNIKCLSSSRISNIRRELDKQLTTMIVVLDIFNIIALMPYPIILIIRSISSIIEDPFTAEKTIFISNLTVFFYYLYFASPFYIFICVSERFRRQLIYVLFKIHLERWRRRRMISILILPH
ncbi:unnamed protein product [Adineta steineri]|uniref:G-protein coupled receptors family 1 profile domain-containing protein n=2 Tax=Adineta steineri TaxID=433720 RepID=A0A813P1R6_9BILA|nr:unnamed protein product [Adineta steineri]